jgi:hypothetical protein
MPGACNPGPAESESGLRTPSALHTVQALPAQLKQALPVANEQKDAVEETYEHAAASLRELMFGPDESRPAFEARFSAIGNTFSSLR